MSTYKSQKGFFLVVALLLAGFLLAYRPLLQFVLPTNAGLAPGRPVPRIQAEGWLNGPAPPLDALAGKVVVLDAWASWCGPCRQKAPELVRTYHKFEKKGVVFIGLSGEAADRIPQMQEFLKSTGVAWPNGYGAVETLTELDADWIPQVWVIGRDGKIVWNEASGTPLERGIETALTQ